MILRIIFFWFLCMQGAIFCQERGASVKVLIVGCGRSGTTYISDLLTTAGLNIFHEKPMALNGVASWTMVFNSYSPWGPIEDMPAFDHIFHQVRNPLDVLTSWLINLYDLNRDEWQFIRSHIPEISEEDPLLTQCVKYWYYWNLRAEEMSEWTYRIEDIDNLFPIFEEKLGIALDRNALESVPRGTNSWKPAEVRITWGLLQKFLPENLFYNVLGMAKRYGYPTDD